MKKILRGCVFLALMGTALSCTKSGTGGTLNTPDTFTGTVNGGPWSGTCGAAKSYVQSQEYILLTSRSTVPPFPYIVVYFPFSKDMANTVALDMVPNIPNGMYITTTGGVIDTSRSLSGAVHIVDRDVQLTGSFNFTAQDGTVVEGTFNCQNP
jgi:hypothetical protein